MGNVGRNGTAAAPVRASLGMEEEKETLQLLQQMHCVRGELIEILTCSIYVQYCSLLLSTALYTDSIYLFFQFCWV